MRSPAEASAILAGKRPKRSRALGVRAGEKVAADVWDSYRSDADRAEINAEEMMREGFDEVIEQSREGRS